MNLSVFFPAYNEEGNIQNTVKKALAVCKNIKEIEKFEIIIVDDGSEDATGKIANTLAEEHPEVRVIHHKKNRGYGTALKTGLYNSKYEWIVYTDSDGQFDFAEVTKFIRQVTSGPGKEKSQVLGPVLEPGFGELPGLKSKSRHSGPRSGIRREGGRQILNRVQNDDRGLTSKDSAAESPDFICGYKIKRADSLIRKVNAKLWGLLIRILFGLDLKDRACGFKMIRKEVIETIPEIETDGAVAEDELLIKAKRAGFTFAEVPVHHYPRTAGKQTGSDPRVILKAFRELWYLWGVLG